MLSGVSLTNEKSYLIGKFARLVLHTANLDYNGRFCMVSVGAGNKKALGVDRSPNPWSDIPLADVVWVAGSNIAETFPITTSYIWRARDRGAKLIVQDPRVVPLARTADLFLPVRPGSDSALFGVVLHELVRNDWLDHAFIEAHTVDFDQTAAEVEDMTPKWAEGITGVPAARIGASSRVVGHLRHRHAAARSWHRAADQRRRQRAVGDQPGLGHGQVRQARLRGLDNHRSGQRPRRSRAWPQVRPAPGQPRHHQPRAPRVRPASVRGCDEQRDPRQGRARGGDHRSDPRRRDQGAPVDLLQPRRVATRLELHRAQRSTSSSSTPSSTSSCPSAPSTPTSSSPARSTRRTRAPRRRAKGASSRSTLRSRPPGEARRYWEILLDIADRLGQRPVLPVHEHRGDLRGAAHRVVRRHRRLPRRRPASASETRWACSGRSPRSAIRARPACSRAARSFTRRQGPLPRRAAPVGGGGRRASSRPGPPRAASRASTCRGTQTRRIGALVEHTPNRRARSTLARRASASTTGDPVTVTSRRGSITLPAPVVTTIRPDTVFIPYHWPGATGRRTSSPSEPSTRRRTCPSSRSRQVRVEKVGRPMSVRHRTRPRCS